jgi:molybdenum cofactor biosynthesis protein B
MPLDQTLEFSTVRVALLRILDNRTRTDDAAGDILAELLAAAGHEVVDRERVAPEIDAVTDHLRLWVRDPEVDCVITVGGTGLSSRDVAPEALALVWDREIPGFGELFRSISVASVGTSALQSRACAGVAGDTCLFALPGSPGGVRDAWDGILASQLDSRHKPCNLVELMACPTRR